MNVRFSLGFLLALACVLFGIAPSVHAQTMTCASGGTSHPATAQEAAAAPNGQIIAGVTQVCPGDAQLGISNSAGAAKADLATMARGSGGSCGTTAPASFQQLDPAFAICADRFLQMVRSRDPNIHITSAYRSAAQQACVCAQTSGPCAAPGNSMHQKGLAIDIQDGSSNTIPSWIHAAAAGYGITFPVKNDDGHMQPIPGSNCSDPNFSPTDTSGGLPAQTTSTGNNTPLRPQTIANPTQPTITPAQSPSLAPQQATASPAPTSANPNSATTFGSSALTANPFSVNPFVSPAPSLIATSATSALASIQTIANPVSVVANPPSSTTSPELSSGIYTIAQVASTSGSISPAGNTTVTNVDQFSAQQTFTSTDLSQSPQTNTATLSPLMNILNTLQTALGDLLAYLNGSSAPAQHPQE